MLAGRLVSWLQNKFSARNDVLRQVSAGREVNCRSLRSRVSP